MNVLLFTFQVKKRERDEWSGKSSVFCFVTDKRGRAAVLAEPWKAGGTFWPLVRKIFYLDLEAVCFYDSSFLRVYIERHWDTWSSLTLPRWLCFHPRPFVFLSTILQKTWCKSVGWVRRESIRCWWRFFFQLSLTLRLGPFDFSQNNSWILILIFKCEKFGDLQIQIIMQVEFKMVSCGHCLAVFAEVCTIIVINTMFNKIEIWIRNLPARLSSLYVLSKSTFPSYSLLSVDLACIFTYWR